MRAPIRLLWITPPDGSLDLVDELLAERTDVPGLALLVRRPSSSDRRVLEEARHLMRHGVPILMTRADLALAIGAAGVHFPERGLGPSEGRIRPEWIVGVSRHDHASLRASTTADYATLSPFGPVEGKGPALGEDGFRAALHEVPIPVLALGGIDAESAKRALGAGASGLAFIRAGLSRREFDSLVKVLDSPERSGEDEEPCPD